MFDELNLSVERKWHYEVLAAKAIASLKKNYINAEYAVDRQEALSKVLDMIPEEATIGIGDSVTLYQIGLISQLESPKYKNVLNHLRRNPDGSRFYTYEEHYEIARKVLTSDVYLTSTNAITLDGKLVNVDGFGNRVAAMIFGPKKVIVVAGANKIAKNVEEAIKRIKEISAPMNAKRHIEKHHRADLAVLPCVKTGVCADCAIPERICNVTVIIERAGKSRVPITSEPGNPQLAELNVVIVGEDLGL